MNCYCQDYLDVFGEPAAPITAVQTPPVLDEVDKEIVKLARHLGGIQNGQKIEMTLQELLEVIPHTRRRSDSYVRLTKKLRADYDVDLKIVASKINNTDERKDR